MSARISKMYKDSGGCNTEHKCKECRHFADSGIKNEYVCKRQVSDDRWDGEWMSCKFFEDRGDEPMEVIVKDELTIDPEFSKIIPPLTKEEYAGLEKSILEEGCRVALDVWIYEGKTILIDGHNRYNICRKHGIDYKTYQHTFESRDHAIIWIIDNQKNRHNLHTYDALLLEDRKKDVLARMAQKGKGGDRRSAEYKESNDKKSCELKEPETKEEKKERNKQERRNKTDYKIAKAAGSSEDTLRKVREIERKATPKTKELIRSGDLSINQAYNSVHPKKKKPDIVAEAKKEHEEFQKKKAEHTVSFKEVQEDKNNQRIVNDALLMDIIKLFNAIDDFGSKYKSEELQNLSASIKEDERPKYVQQCDLCQRILETIRKSL